MIVPYASNTKLKYVFSSGTLTNYLPYKNVHRLIFCYFYTKTTPILHRKASKAVLWHSLSDKQDRGENV